MLPEETALAFVRALGAPFLPPASAFADRCDYCLRRSEKRRAVRVDVCASHGYCLEHSLPDIQYHAAEAAVLNRSINSS
jgi:hypothetical protein